MTHADGVTTIARLEAELSEARRERDGWRELVRAAAASDAATIRYLRNENERLREALREIASAKFANYCDCSGAARAALEGTP